MPFSGADGMVLPALSTAMSLTAGLTLLVPALVGPVIGALTRPLARRPGATALLVRENMITAVRRTSATVDLGGGVRGLGRRRGGPAG
ncbi:hypothetical protein ABZ078_21610 [Streptomyces sp. NPDC006385]|uniref:hypothetical protein n=1 Tax=Streptomyces sp. NPDC006385 TaxID=3156761 RepID=UPI0033B9BA4D